MKKYFLLLVFCIVNATQTVLGDTSTISPSLDLNYRGRGKYIVARDRARISQLFNPNRPKEVPITDELVSYVATVLVGEGNYTVIVDTGSSNTWIGANSSNPYRPSKHSQDTGQDVLVRYGSGNFTGQQFIDTLQLPGIPYEIKQSVGVANSSFGFDGVDGILGVGPRILTNNTLIPAQHQLVPTVTDNLVTHHIIPHNLTGILVSPHPININSSGRFDLGTLNTTGLTSAVHYAPITKTAPFNRFWAVDQSMTYGEGKDAVSLFDEGPGLVDLGTSVMAFSSDSFQKYMELTGSVPDNATGLLRIEDPGKLKSMIFHIGHEKYELTANAQIWPRTFNEDIGGSANATYLAVIEVPPSPPGSAMFNKTYMINGIPFMERFYCAFDGGNSRVGFATTKFTFSEVN